jgi:spore maturation protein CgeB
LHYYLEHDEEREHIALNGYRRVIKDHRLRHRMRQAGELIEQGMVRVGWSRSKVSSLSTGRR